MDDERLAAEQRARVLIDRQLEAAGWLVQDHRDVELMAGQGVAVREVVMPPATAGSITCSTSTAASSASWRPSRRGRRCPASSGSRPCTPPACPSGTAGARPCTSETHLTNGFDPNPRARRFPGFPQPRTIARWLRDAEADPGRPTWRAKVADLPPVPGPDDGMRAAQTTALSGIERSLREGRHDRSLVRWATGAGKTYTAVSECYRLLKHGGVRRILFLVDRTNLGEQALGEFASFVTPDDGRKFTELYPTAMLTAAGMLDSASVVVSTIQRVHAVLNGQEVTAGDDPQLDAFVPDGPVQVPYSARMPPESFDLVIVDECHRSIYGVWRGVLEYFDAHLLGLTATPVKQTFGYFRPPRTARRSRPGASCR